ncbi:MAG: hypothetical protein GY847_15135 [Proteobacteria bacterium]|nr:hypothetical protein [Pseudomonadota bacterium]
MMRVSIALYVIFALVSPCTAYATEKKESEKSPDEISDAAEATEQAIADKPGEGDQEPGEQKQSASLPSPTTPKLPENTLNACRDGLDNDSDDHVDCDDQDCEIFAICVEKTESEDEGSTGPAPAEEPSEKKEEEIIHRPFSIGFVPGLTTDGGTDKKVRNSFSLNFIGWGDYLTGADLSFIGGIRKFDVKGFQGAGIFNYTNGEFRGFQGSGITSITRGAFTGFQASGIASLSGAEFSGFKGAGIANVTHGPMTGFHGAGIANVIGNSVRGFTAAGIANVTGGPLVGFQGAGIANAATGPVSGFQGAGIANAARGSVSGFQGAGIANVATGPTIGFQGAGIANYAESIKGAQMSGIANIARGDVTGLQAGLINFGTRVHGAQIGLVNIALKEMKGAPIGLINYAGDGIFAPTIWGSDNSMLNLGLKMGSRHIYGILGWGIHPIPDEKRDSLITGLGGHVDLHPVWLDIDLTFHWLHENFKWIENEVDLIHKLRIAFGYRVLDQLSVFAGPTLNLLVSEVRDDADLIPSFASYTNDDLSVKFSIGFVAGLQWEPKLGALNTR